MSDHRPVGQGATKDLDPAIEQATQAFARLQRSTRRELGPFAGFVQIARSIDSAGDMHREGPECD
jgi:hypothetical protein